MYGMGRRPAGSAITAALAAVVDEASGATSACRCRRKEMLRCPSLLADVLGASAYHQHIQPRRRVVESEAEGGE